ncbi:hypothetical protein CIPAW_01G108000 [Carya illinoinensis]|uniref:Uncharacterized protein n=1 Tax=Carya illinoinensis TaxID=32201 RepID=A0A8T1RLJ9_CARIL|nr:hypothetical protein CIPAW_01G108000 [Carya illinoinensis]
MPPPPVLLGFPRQLPSQLSLNQPSGRPKPFNYSSSDFCTSLKCRIPKPPSFVGLHTFSQDIQCNFLLFSISPHKKLARGEFIRERVVIGTFITDIRWIGMLDKTCLTRINLPPCERSQNFNPAIFFLTFSTRYSKILLKHMHKVLIEHFSPLAKIRTSSA